MTGPRRSGRRDSGLLLIASRWAIEGGGRAFGVALTVFIAPRILGPAAWGWFWGAFGAMYVLALFTDLGGHLNLARRAAAAPARARPLLGSALRMKHVLAVIVLAAWAIILPHPPGTPPATSWLLVLGALALSYIEVAGYFLRGLGRVLAEAAILALDSVLACALGLAALAAGTGAAGLAGALLAAHAVVLTGIWSRLRFPLPGSESAPPSAVTRHAAGSAPLAVYLLAMSASWRLGTLWLPWCGTVDPDAAGCYAAVHRLFEAARFFPYVAAAALFPSFARPDASPWPALRWLVPLSAAGAAAAALPPVAHLVVTTVFGSAYEPASPLLSVIAWTLPLMCLSAPLISRLVARGHTAVAGTLAALHLCVHAAALALLVPAHGATGAAWAFVAAEAAVALASLAAILRWNR